MKIAIVKLSALGDIVHAMVTLQYMKQKLPSLQIDWVVEQAFVKVLEGNPHIDNILPVHLKAIKRDRKEILKQIRLVRHYAKNNYDIVIDMQGLIKSAIVSKILGLNAGFDRDSIREKTASFFYKKSFFIPYEENVIVRNLELIASVLQIEFEKKILYTKEPFLFFLDKDREKIASFLSDEQKNIVYILGSSWESKIYPKERFVEVISALEGNHLLVWGNETEHSYAQFVSKNSSAHLLPSLTLNELKALIYSADLVIGGDSGPTHFAWAMNRPSITIFGPTPSKRNILETNINKVIDCEKEIDPRRLNRKDFCICNIDPSKIVKLAKELLS